MLSDSAKVRYLEELLTKVREAADLGFASADVSTEHTAAYDEICQQADEFMATTSYRDRRTRH